MERWVRGEGKTCGNLSAMSVGVVGASGRFFTSAHNPFNTSRVHL
jgi:hypothetical protein